MKKISILLIGLMVAPAAFAGGYGLTTPIKLESVPVVSVQKISAPRVVVKKTNCSSYERRSRWFECDTKSELSLERYQNTRALLSERFSDSQRPTLRNRATRGQDIEREYDRQAAARNKLLRYRRAFNK